MGLYSIPLLGEQFWNSTAVRLRMWLSISIQSIDQYKIRPTAQPIKPDTDKGIPQLAPRQISFLANSLSGRFNNVLVRRCWPLWIQTLSNCQPNFNRRRFSDPKAILPRAQAFFVLYRTGWYFKRRRRKDKLCTLPSLGSFNIIVPQIQDDDPRNDTVTSPKSYLSSWIVSTSGYAHLLSRV